jgi:hypothetical protein
VQAYKNKPILSNVEMSGIRQFDIFLINLTHTGFRKCLVNCHLAYMYMVLR